MTKQVKTYVFHANYLRNKEQKIDRPPEQTFFLEKRKQISHVPQLIKQVEEFIQSEDAEGLKKLLVEDFFIKSLGIVTESKSSDDLNLNVRRLGFCKILHEQFEVRSNIEQLLLTENAFRSILRMSMTIPIKQALFASLKYLDLAPKELIDFSDMDLTGASFNGANLGTSVFNHATLDQVDFSNANLSHCMMTQAQLDRCASYNRAQVPNHLSIYWNEEIKKTLLDYLINLQAYAMEKIPENDPKHIKIKQLMNEYGMLLDPRSPNPPIEDKKKMLNDFRQSKPLFSSHRNLRYLFGEFLAILCGFVLGYVAVGLYNYKKTGTFGIFTRAETLEKTDELLDYIKNNDAGLFQMQ